MEFMVAGCAFALQNRRRKRNGGAISTLRFKYVLE
jgi:hypothetical protein